MDIFSKPDPVGALDATKLLQSNSIQDICETVRVALGYSLFKQSLYNKYGYYLNIHSPNHLISVVFDTDFLHFYEPSKIKQLKIMNSPTEKVFPYLVRNTNSGIFLCN